MTTKDDDAISMAKDSVNMIAKDIGETLFFFFFVELELRKLEHLKTGVLASGFHCSVKHC